MNRSLALLILLGSLSAAAEVDFNRDIRPILNQRCTSCHGGVKRKGGFSLLYRSELLKPAKSGEIPLVPGEPQESAILHRITSTDEDERMPPEGDALSERQVALIQEWIDQGAPYAEHWAFVKPERHEGASIDAFVRKRLESENLSPAPAAPRHTLLRRLHLDLIGLPPSPDDSARFMADQSAVAYEREVDRLLASPRYGERWAAMWLDLARYADTQGYEKDAQRSISPYRDWVIDAFNRDLPFDQFTVEQLAGDLLPNATEQQQVATGFHRNTMTNTEGGTDDEEFRTAAIIDRVNTTWEVWMGVSFGCVQCHNHPYDPFLQTDYYQFMDFLNSTEDADRGNDSPFITVLGPGQRAQHAQLEQEITALKAKLAESANGLDTEQAKWEAELLEQVSWETPRPLAAESAESGVTMRIADDGAILVGGPNPKTNTYTIALDSELSQVAALRIDTIPHKSFKRGGSGRANDGNFVLSNIALNLVAADGAKTPLPLGRAVADFSQGDFGVALALKGDRQKQGWAQAPHQAKPHWAAFALKTPAALPDGAKLEVVLTHSFHMPNFALGHFRLSLSSSAAQLEAQPLPADLLAAARTPKAERSPVESKRLRDRFAEIAPALKAIRAEIAKKEKARPKGRKTLVLRELSTPRPTHVFNGGNWLAKGDRVQRGTPGSLPAFPEGVPNNRLGMAKWMVRPDHPLTARVAVNRFWEQIFGTGIVRTIADFGTQGELPSHPALLDDLAVRFMGEMKWSVKALLKEMVMSGTYRQSSRTTPDLLERDPLNRLLARGARYRLSAEQIRDQSLAIAGLLSDKAFGPSVMPPQPDGIWQVVYSGARWVTPTNEDRYRRGLYTFWRRTSPYPSMESFDAPSREFCVTSRIRTNTPLQALVTMNDPAFIEAAQGMARRMVSGGGASPADKVTHGFALALARPPTPAERDRLVSLYQSEQAYYRDNNGDAVAFSGAKENAVELAAWTAVANVFLNLDQTLTRE